MTEAAPSERVLHAVCIMGVERKRRIATWIGDTDEQQPQRKEEVKEVVQFGSTDPNTIEHRVDRLQPVKTK